MKNLFKMMEVHAGDCCLRVYFALRWWVANLEIEMPACPLHYDGQGDTPEAALANLDEMIGEEIKGEL